MRRLSYVIAGFAALALAVLVPLQPVRAQTYPDHTIRILIPLAAGSAVDVVARIVAEDMSKTLGQGVVVENQAGAAGLIGMRTGAKATPDGYTLVAVNDSVMTMLPNLRADAGYDPIKDFAPITQLVRINWALVAHPSAGLSGFDAFLAKARAEPDGMTYGSGGIGSPQHVAMEMLMQATGTKLRHVPYRGVTQGLNDLVSGHIPVMFLGLPMPNEFVKGGQLQMLGAAAQRRFDLFPDRPTIAESGVAGFSFYTWGGLLAPAGTPPEIVAKLNAAATKALADPTVAKRLTDLGYEVVGNTPDAFAAALAVDYKRMGALIKAANIKVEQP